MFKQKKIIIDLWITFFTVVAWIGFSLYHAWITSTISPVDASLIAPIVPKFDKDTINNLKRRETIEPLYRFSKTEENIATKGAKISVTP